jgi:L-2-hydroxyglutarate oxidase LhgO
MSEAETIIIGSGIIGLSIAYKLSKSTSNIVVLEKNESFGQETSSRNSEVIHAGLYYPPHSLKAKTCIEGKNLLYEICSKNKIPYRRTAKLVISFNQEGSDKIRKIYENACNCGVTNLRFLTSSQISKLEPDIIAKEGFLSPETGILDTHSLMKFLYNRAKSCGVTFAFSTPVIGIDKQNSEYQVTVKEQGEDNFILKSPVVINAAGLYADKIAQMAGIDINKYSYKLHYCRGQYFRIKNPSKFSIQHLVYPPPTAVDLGIHITPDLGGGLRLGPDAKYVSGIDYNINDSDKPYFYKSIKNFLPQLKLEDLIPDTVGIRPKLQKETEDFKDFIISEESQKGFEGFVNLIGIESPGFTACLSIAERVKNILKKS